VRRVLHLGLLALLACVFSVCAEASVTLVQSNSTSTATTTSGTVALSSTIGAGDLIIVGINFGSTTPTSYSNGTNYVVSDTNSLTWNACPVGPVIQGNAIGCYYAIDSAGHSSTTVTVTINNGGSHTLRLAAYEYSSTTGWAASPADTQNSNSNSSAVASGNGGAVTPAQAHELLWAAIQFNTAGATAITGTGTCTERPAGGGSGLGWVGGARADACDVQDSTASATTPGFSWSSVSSAYSALVVAFKPGSSNSVSVSVTLTESDSVAYTVQRAVGLTESAGVTDTPTAIQALHVADSESNTTSMSVNIGKKGQPNESLTTSGTLTVLSGRGGAPVENLTTSDSVAYMGAFVRGPPETLTTSDSVSAARNGQAFSRKVAESIIVESLSLRDSVGTVKGGNFVASVSESHTTTPSVAAVKPNSNPVAVNEYLAIFDTAGIQTCVQGPLTESHTTVDSVGVSSSSGAKSLNPTEILTTSPSVATQCAHVANVTETLSESDSVRIGSFAAVAIVENLTTAAQATLGACQSCLNEVHTTSDVAAGVRSAGNPFAVAVTESLAESETVSTGGSNYHRSLAEAQATQDAVTGVRSKVGSVTENLTLIDTVIPGVSLHVSVAESKTTADAVSNAGSSYKRNATVSLAESDLAAASPTSVAKVSEAMSLTDAVSAIAQHGPGISESLVTVDSISVIVRRQGQLRRRFTLIDSN
jgi:hypothetical protein